MNTVALLLQSGGGSTAAFLINILPIAAIFAVFYFLVIAPANKVVTSGGIYGTVQGVEAEVIYLKIAENVKVKVSRSAVTGVVSSEEAP
jgi:preprotein translocase subunit YajC